MKKVASIVLNNFLHDSRVLKECLSLQKAGYAVQVVALHEGDLAEYEEVQGVPVHRVKLSTRSWSKNRAVQLLKFFELLYRVIKDYRHYDIIHCNDVSPLPIGVFIKTFFNRNAKVIYDAHELEFDKNTNSSFLSAISRWTERLFINKADGMMTVSDFIADAYVEEYGIKRPEIVKNCPMLQQVKKQNIFRERFGIKEEQQIVLYQGLLAPKRGIELLIEAFQEMDDQQVLVLLGYGALEEKIKAAAEKHSNIFFHEAVSPSELLNYTASADIGTYLIENSNQSHYYSLGNKLFQYIMSGIPVISSNLGAVKKVISPQVGVILEEDSVAQLIKAIQIITSKGNDYYRPHLAKVAKEYCWENQEKTMFNLYKSVYEV